MILRLMLVPDKPGTRDLSRGFHRLQQRGSPVAAAGGGLDEDDVSRSSAPANRMALLNIEAKLRETFVDGTSVLSFVKAVRHVAVDRLFLLVDASLKDRLARAARLRGRPGPRAHRDTRRHAGASRQLEARTLCRRERAALVLGRGGAAARRAWRDRVHSVDVDIDLGRGLAHVVE